MIILQIGWDNQFKIPEAMLPLLPQMVAVKEVKNQWVESDKEVKVLFVKGEMAEPAVAEAVSLAQLKEDLEQRNTYWMQEREKVAKLEAKIKELQPA